MTLKTHLVEHPNGTIAVADIEPDQILDRAVAARLRSRLSAILGGMPALLRYKDGEDLYVLSGDAHLHRYGVDPIIDVLPSIEVNV